MSGSEKYETAEEEDGQLAWLLPRGANPIVNGKRCTCGVSVAIKGASAEMHVYHCELYKGKPGGKDETNK